MKQCISYDDVLSTSLQILFGNNPMCAHSHISSRILYLMVIILI